MTEFDRTRRMGALLSAMAAILMTGCSQDTAGNCVDQSGRLHPDYDCRNPSRAGSGYYGYPHWVYGGRRSGSYITGYSLSPPSGGRIVTPSGSVLRSGSVARGGFGFFGGGRGFGGGS